MEKNITILPVKIKSAPEKKVWVKINGYLTMIVNPNIIINELILAVN